MTTSTPEITSQLKDFLSGYAGRDPNALSPLAEFDGWAKLAKQELNRRAYRLIETFDDDALRAIASGEINLSDLCRELTK